MEGSPKRAPLSLVEAQIEVPRKDFDVSNFRPEVAIGIIDDIIVDLYQPSRGQPGCGTERAIYVEPPHAPHRENNAEHAYHVAKTVAILWDNRETIGLGFPEDFNAPEAVWLALDHDDMENLGAGDVDTVTPDQNALLFKKKAERDTQQMIYEHKPYLRGVADRWGVYEVRDTSNAIFVSEVDKVVGTRIICLDGGRKWREWPGYQTTREKMCSSQRAKFLTTFGHMLFDVIELELDAHPEYFPESA